MAKVNRSLRLPASLPVITSASRILLPGGIMHIVVAHDDEHIKLAERLFWSSSLENPSIIGLLAIAAPLTIQVYRR